MNFDDFTNSASAQRTKLHTLRLHCVFPNMQLKPESKFFSKYLHFLTLVRIEMKVS